MSDMEEAAQGDAAAIGAAAAAAAAAAARAGMKGKSKQKKKKGGSCGFETLGLCSEVYRGVKRKGYQVPTPIQRKTLPLVLAGHDVVAMARTGSGKTAAFLIPMIERLRCHSPRPGARAVILSPTRELALQTYKFARELSRYTDLRMACLVGGDSMESQFEALAANPDVIIATPGRLMHHLSEVEGMSLKSVEYVVFDEADRLFEMGFAAQLREILRAVPESRQTLLFSATMPRLLAEFARAGLREPHVVRLDTDTKISPDLRLEFFTARPSEKIPVLLHLLRETLLPAEQQTIIFVATKHHVELLSEILKAEGVDASVVYGAMDQTARKIHMAKFRARKTFLLVVTDVAARGLDVPLLDNVVNFDFPPKPKLFVHRAGRAARAGRVGTAYSFLSPEELPYLLDLHLFLSRPVRAAPREDQIEQSGGEVLRESQSAAERGETVYGRFPQPVIDVESERVRQLVASNYAVASLLKVCEKAMRLYVKTRPAPSSESVKRAKELPVEGVSLALRADLTNVDAAAAAFAEHLKNFRPKQTVLEAEADGGGGGSRAGAAARKAAAGGAEAMRKKRQVHEALILQTKKRKMEKEEGRRRLSLESQAGAGEEGGGEEGVRISYGDDGDGDEWEKREREEGGDVSKVVDQVMGLREGKKEKRKKTAGAAKERPTSFRDEEFYINDIPPNRHMENAFTVNAGRHRETFGTTMETQQLEAEILDLMPEDSEGVKKQRSSFHWDKKAKKYVKLHAGETLTSSGKVRNESGAKVNVNSRGIYKRWQERTHMSVGGGDDDGDSRGPTSSGPGQDRRGARGGRGSGAGRGGRGSGQSTRVRDELKGVEEVRKMREKQALRGGRGRGRGGRGGGGRGGGRVGDRPSQMKGGRDGAPSKGKKGFAVGKARGKGKVKGPVKGKGRGSSSHGGKKGGRP